MCPVRNVTYVAGRSVFALSKISSHRPSVSRVDIPSPPFLSLGKSGYRKSLTVSALSNAVFSISRCNTIWYKSAL
jgi:hypothetical protein